MQEEKKEQIVLDPQDMDVIERFFTHFSIDIPDYLKKSIENFKKDQTIDTQNAVKLSLSKAVQDRGEDVMKIDEIFEPVIKACGEVAYNMQFDKDLEDVIGQDENELTDQNQSQSSSQSADSQEPANS